MGSGGSKSENSSLDSVDGVYKFVVDFRNANNQHVSENKELKSMVALYLENTTKTLNLLEMDKCTDEFATQYKSVYKEQVMLLAKICELQVELEKKHKKAKRKRNIGYAAFGVALAPFIVVTLLAASNPAVANVFNSQVSNAGGNVVERLKKLADLLTGYEKSVETQLVLYLLIEHGTRVNTGAMENLVE